MASPQPVHIPGKSAVPSLHRIRCQTPLHPLVKPSKGRHLNSMVPREDILILGLTSGVVGSLTGGLMLGVGLGMVSQGAHAGWLLVLPAGPIAGLLGYALARRLVKQPKI